MNGQGGNPSDNEMFMGIDLQDYDMYAQTNQSPQIKQQQKKSQPAKQQNATGHLPQPMISFPQQLQPQYYQNPHFEQNQQTEQELLPTPPTKKPKKKKQEPPPPPPTPEYTGPRVDVVFTFKKDQEKIEYLVKFVNQSYRSKTWISNSEDPESRNKIRKFLEDHPDGPPEPPYYSAEYDTPFKVIDNRKVDVNETGESEEQFLVVWKGLSRKNATWEKREDYLEECIKEFNTIPPEDETANEPKKNYQLPLDQSFLKSLNISIDPSHINPLNELIRKWYDNQNLILPDECVTEKMEQLCVFLNYLNKGEHQYGPFLILTTNNLMEKWEEMIKKNTSLKVLVVGGSKADWKVISKHEIFFKGTMIVRFQVFITTFEAISKMEELSVINWVTIFVDGQQKFKVTTDRTFSLLNTLPVIFKAVIISSKIADKTSELFNYLNFAAPVTYPSKKRFMSKYSKMNPSTFDTFFRSPQEETQGPKQLEEIVIDCPMTEIQCALYKEIIMANDDYVNSPGPKNIKTLTEISKELRKVCNHPMIIDKNRIKMVKYSNGDFSEDCPTSEDPDYQLITTESGKMLVFIELIEKMKREGNRVLVLCQMPQMIDTLRKYVMYKGYNSQFIDFSTKTVMPGPQSFREFCIYITNSQGFAFDAKQMNVKTFIVFVSNFLPRRDNEAIMRCCKGSPAKIYRLVTGKSYDRILYDKGLDKQEESYASEEVEQMINYTKYLDPTIVSKDSLEPIETIIANSERFVHDQPETPESSGDLQVPTLNPNEEPGNTSLYQEVPDDPDYFDEEPQPKKRGKRKAQPKTGDMNIPIQQQTENELQKQQKKQKQQKQQKQPKQKQQEDEEQKEDEETENSEDEDSDSNERTTSTTDKPSFMLIEFMMKFGFSRYTEFHSEDNQEVVTSDLVYYILSHMLTNADTEFGSFRLVEKFIVQYMPQKNLFLSRNRREYLLDVLGQFPKARLTKINTAEFISRIVGSHDTPEEAIPIPNIISENADEKWGVKQDQRLLKLSYIKGLGEVTKDDFEYVPENFQFIERVRTITSLFEELFAVLQKKRGREYNINIQNATDALSYFTRSEHDYLICKLCDKDITDIDDFVPKLCIKKPGTALKDYIKLIIDEAKNISNGTFQESRLQHSLNMHSAQRITNSIELYEHLHKAIDDDKFTDEFKNVARITINCGYEEAIRNSDVQRFLGSNIVSVRSLQVNLRRVLFNEQPREDQIELKEEALDIPEEKDVVEDAKDKAETQKDKAETQKEKAENKKEKAENKKEKAENKKEKAENKREKPGNKKEKVANKKDKAAEKTKHENHAANKEETEKESDDSKDEFPKQIQQSLTLVSLGKIVYDRDSFQTDRYVYCPGFITERLYTSLLNPKERVWYRSMILDGKTQPIFRVELKDDPSISFEANTPSNPWLTVMRAVEKKKKEVGMTYTRTPSCSGPEFFGLANHAISRLISKLPDFEKIENKKADLKKSSEPAAPTKHFARGSSGARRGRAVASSDSTSESDDSSDEEFQSNAMQSSSSSSSLSSESESENEREGENVEDKSRTNQIKFIEAEKKSESEDEKEDEKQEIKEEEEEKEVEQKQQKSSSDSNNKKDDDGDDFSDDSVPIPANDASEHECEQQPEISETQEEHGPSLKFNFKKLIESAPASEIHILIPGKQKEITDFLKDDHVTSESIV